jgi:hypothetical protein
MIPLAVVWIEAVAGVVAPARCPMVADHPRQVIVALRQQSVEILYRDFTRHISGLLVAY